PRGPQAVAGPERPDPLAGYAGRTLILRHVGDIARPTLSNTDLASLTGRCDVVVNVQQARWDGGAAHFTLNMIGRPRASRWGSREERCDADRPQIVLAVSGFDPAISTADLDAALL